MSLFCYTKDMLVLQSVDCRDCTAARGTTVVQLYKVKVVRSTTYSPTYSSILVGVSSSWTTSLNNVTEKPLTPWSICARTLNQVWILD